MTEASRATVRAIWRKPAKKAPMEARRECTLEVGAGQVGARSGRGDRQVTLLDEARWEDAVRELGTEVPPSARRADFLLEGIELAESVGRRLRIGGAVIEVRGETVPCGRMDAACPGLRAALEPAWRGGVYGRVIESGPVAVGDGVAFLPEAD